MGWNQDEEQRSHYDSAAGKNYGETYSEAGDRHRKEAEQARKGEKPAQYDGNPLKLPGEKTAFAKLLLNFGWGAVGVGILLWILPVPAFALDGIPLSRLLIGAGAACLALVHLFQVFALILSAAAILILGNAGMTDHGFSLGAIPFKAYLISVGIIAMVYIVSRALARKA